VFALKKRSISKDEVACSLSVCDAQQAMINEQTACNLPLVFRCDSRTSVC